MRWDALFADLEGQFGSERRREHDEDIAQRVRYELGRQGLSERLRGHCGRRLRLGLRGPLALTLRIDEVGPDWLLGGDDAAGPATECLLPLSAVCWVEGLGLPVQAPPEGRVWHRLDLRRAVRGLAQERVAVRLFTTDGAWEQGTFDRVYADHVDFSRHPAGEARRPAAVQATRAVPWSAMVLIRRQQ
ncbi:MAG TPA: hypothetical protein VHC41_07360 [Mycobacteriales bacterium]|jgi:hypothetical protein|nr:hypothetical protein [Mycobacteriales bacterium]